MLKLGYKISKPVFKTLLMLCIVNKVLANNEIIYGIDVLGDAKNSLKISQQIAQAKNDQNNINAKQLVPNKAILQPTQPTYKQDVKMIDVNSQVAGLLDALNQVNDKLSNKLNASMPELLDIAQQLPEVDTNIEQVALYVKGLARALGVISNQLKTQQQKLDNFILYNIGKPTTKASGEPGLMINTMISTRVWLQTVKGKQFTVGLGDVIPGYGKVTAINIKENFILTDMDIKITR